MTKSVHRQVRVGRVWVRTVSRAIHRARTAILTAVVLLMLVAAGAAGFFYHSAKAMDKQLREGPFRDAVNIYATEIVLSAGENLGIPDLKEELRLAGYEESSSAKPGTFAFAGKELEVIPFDGSAQSRPRILIGDKQQIARIDVDGHEVKTWDAGCPLIANLSSGREKRHMVTFGEIPPVLVHAVVSAEDKHFFQHRGLDLARIMKAAYVDVQAGRKEQGASTLTMQLVRGLWLGPEKRWKRKFAEGMMTIYLEHKWSKEEIFETYANQVYLGRQAAYSIHGFSQASQMFFGKDLGNLTLPEAALLAGMVQRPSYFNPYRNPDHARERRNLVLALMRGNGYITKAEYLDGTESPLKLAPPQQHDDSFGAPYFLDRVSDELQKIDQPDDGAKDVYTTIDLPIQRAAREAVETGMAEVDKLVAKKYGKSDVRAEAALIALDPHTGEIKAMLGGRDYGLSQFNRILAKRPPGSVFKPFVYAAALNTAISGGDKIFTPASTVNDAPTSFLMDGKPYQPENFRHEQFGTLTLRQALAKSDNIAAVKLAQQVGYDTVVDMARRAGFTSEIGATPSVALGAYAVTPLEIAGAYTAFANGGTWLKPHPIVSVQNGDGETIHRGEKESRQALDPRVAYLMVNLLQEVMRSGTAASVRSRGFVLPAAGKTGTSHDGWFAGFTSDLLCVVWVGFDDYRELELEGAKSALPIWTEFMKKASKFAAYRNAKNFSSPAGIGSAKICAASGKLAGDFCTSTRTELFITGTEPQEPCDLHTAPQDPSPTAHETTLPAVVEVRSLEPNR